jgi:hypothetical protein
LISALNQTVPNHTRFQYPVGLQAERNRVAGRSNFFESIYLQAQHADNLVPIMHDLIEQGGDELERFRNFLFYSVTYGNKVLLPINDQELEQADLQQHLQESYPEILWQRTDARMTFCDFAANLSIEGHTGLWVLDNETTTILQEFFLQPMPAGQYRHDLFAYINNVGGGSFSCNDLHGQGIYRMLGAQAYSTFKNPFYHRRRQGYRHCIDILPTPFLEQANTVDRTIENCQTILVAMHDYSYPARLEFNMIADNLDLIQNLGTLLRR